MANRRMFNKELVSSDKFLDMPASSQALFFHLGINADDEGFVSSPKRISRSIGCSDDEIKILLAKQFVVGFESGVIVIVEWNKHNQLRKDRFTPTLHTQEKEQLQLIDFKQPQPNGNQEQTTGKPSRVELSEEECSTISKEHIQPIGSESDFEKPVPQVPQTSIEFREIYDHWNGALSTVTHRVIKKDMTSAYNSLIADGYNQQEIAVAITTYDQALASDKCWISHKWNLKEFLTQQNACRKFIDCGGDYNWLMNRERGQSERSREAF